MRFIQTLYVIFQFRTMTINKKRPLSVNFCQEALSNFVHALSIRQFSVVRYFV